MLAIATVLLGVAFLILAYNHSQLLRRVEDLEIEKDCARWIVDYWSERTRQLEEHHFKLRLRVAQNEKGIDIVKSKFKGTRYEV